MRQWAIVLFALPALTLTGSYAHAVAYGCARMPPVVSDFALRITLLGPVILIAAALFGSGRKELRSHYAIVQLYIKPTSQIARRLLS